MHALIFGDNKYQPVRMGILRAPGAHRIATHLRKQGLNVEVVDFYLSWTVDELKQIIDRQLEKPTLFIGFSCSLMFDGVEEFHIIRNYIKSKNPNVTIVVGGNKTVYKGFTDADYYIEGSGEESITALVNYLQGKSTELKITEVDGKKVLNSIVDYKVDSVKGINISYRDSDFLGPNEVLSLESARGCIFKCAFCDFPGIGKSKLDYLRDIDEIRDELKENYYKHGTTKYFIVEDTINDTNDKCEMLEEIGQTLPFKLDLMGYMRADLLVNRPKNVEQLVNAGFRGAHLGIETFNHKAGKAIGKGMEPQKLKQGLIDIKKKFPNFYFTGTFIVGLPFETRQEIENTVEWLIKTQVIEFWAFNPLIIPKKNSTFHQSYFSENYRLYDYKEMSDEEFAQRQTDVHKLKYGINWYKDIVKWKNKNFDFVDAALLASSINSETNRYRRIDAWHAWSMVTLGDSLDNILSKSYDPNSPNSLDGVSMERLTSEYIDQYKKKKIEYFNTKFLTEL
jgi:radical SAM superfamily enzyme YgiQ (UPF0313 family)